MESGDGSDGNGDEGSRGRAALLSQLPPTLLLQPHCRCRAEVEHRQVLDAGLPVSLLLLLLLHLRRVGVG